jgi:hypothetical protein
MTQMNAPIVPLALLAPMVLALQVSGPAPGVPLQVSGTTLGSRCLAPRWARSGAGRGYGAQALRSTLQYSGVVAGEEGSETYAGRGLGATQCCEP